MRLPIRCGLIVLAIAALVYVLPGVSLAATINDVFPADPWSDMQIQYTVSGVTVDAPKDTQDFTTVREYKGSTSSDNIHVVGTFFFSGNAGPGGTNYNCEVGLFSLPFWSSDPGELLGKEFNVEYQTGSYVPFDIWLNVPRDQEEVQVKILMHTMYGNWQDRDLDVIFKLTNSYYGVGSSSTGSPSGSGGSGTDPNATGMSPMPLIGTGLLVCLYAILRRSKNE
jgi:hypothetical protein